ncbi:hypothetical protein N0V90_004081 [Kalmusia sp. IMI 367209]|nr:hypothetical protein N0V90_004081 [Kalmusia sp. IMI 367209]
MLPLFGTEYSTVETSDDASVSPRSSTDEVNPEKGLLTNEIKSKWSLNRRLLARRAALAVVVSLLIGSHAILFALGRKTVDLDKKCLHHTSAYSPLLDVMEPGYKMVQFNGTLGYPSEYTGDPSPELDAVWDKWGYVKYASIPDEIFNKLPGDWEGAAKLTPEYGGGYIGFLEFSHHMHCLNMLRQGIHQDYYNDPKHPERMAPVFTDRPFTVKIHMQIQLLDTHMDYPEFTMPQSSYHDLSSTETVNLIEKQSPDVPQTEPRRRRLCFDWRWLVHAILLTISLTSFLAALSLSHSEKPKCDEYPATTYFDRHVDNSWEIRSFTDNGDSPFRGPPSPSVDRAWLKIHDGKSWKNS